MVKPLRFGNRGSSPRLDPRKRIEGGDIFQRRALKDATTAIEKGLKVSDRLKGALGPNADKLIEESANRLGNSGRDVGGMFDPRTVAERNEPRLGSRLGNAFGTPGNAFGSVRDKQREFTKRTALSSALGSAKRDKPFGRLARREFGLDSKERSSALRRRLLNLDGED